MCEAHAFADLHTGQGGLYTIYTSHQYLYMVNACAIYKEKKKVLMLTVVCRHIINEQEKFDGRIGSIGSASDREERHEKAQSGKRSQAATASKGGQQLKESEQQTTTIIKLIKLSVSTKVYHLRFLQFPRMLV